MSKNTRTKYHVRKRMFLNRDLEMRAFAVGIVGDTRHVPNDNEDGWKWRTIELTLADCYRQVSFDFDLGSKTDRAKSLYKIRRIAEIVNAVRQAIEIEVESINARQTAKPKAKAKNAAA